jgi:hypothetical protein
MQASSISEGSIITALIKSENCLIEKRYESESLPQIRNRYERSLKMSSIGRAMGGGNEANDEGEEEDDCSSIWPVSESPEKG